MGTAIREVIDSGSVRVVLQPIVDLRTRKLYAHEVLARCATDAFKSPPAMFDAAVDDDCVGELGRMIRRMAVEAVPDERLFLNIHPRELNERWLVQPDDAMFEHTNDVFLEVTESVPLSHFELCNSVLQEIRGKGIFLVIDDLGAGYSNLKYIADLKPKIVKLDRELVKGLRTGSRLHRLVSSITVLCENLGASVVAEGIETAEELEAVLYAGVHFGQGYLLARPSFPPPAFDWPSLAGDPLPAE